MRIAVFDESSERIDGITDIINLYGKDQVIWTTTDSGTVLDRLQHEKPDLLLLGLFSDTIDTAQVTREVMQQHACPIVLLTSDINHNADIIFRAMSFGALDVISLGPDTNNPEHELFSKLANIKKLIEIDKSEMQTNDPSITPASPAVHPLICIGSSTGGPGALSTILQQINEQQNASYILVQHVNKSFTEGLAEWLNNQCCMPVKVANHFEKILPGHIYLAGGDKHLQVTENGTMEYTSHPRDYAYKPSINIFFESAARYWQGPLIGILLTGMGQDGAIGLASLKTRGGLTIAQDEKSCAVFGMPRAAIELNAAGKILPLDMIASEVNAVIEQLSTNKINKSITGKDISHG